MTVPDAEGETYVVISMQPLSDMTNGSTATHRQLFMCGSASWLSRAVALAARSAPTIVQAARRDSPVLVAICAMVPSCPHQRKKHAD